MWGHTSLWLRSAYSWWFVMWASFHVSDGHLYVFFGNMFRSSAHFLIRLFEILLSNDMSSLCILVINTFQIWGLQVFLSRSWGCFFVLAKHLPTMRETWVQALGREVPLEKEMATHSRIPAWKIPWTEEPSRLQSTGLQRVGHDWATPLHFASLCRAL